MAPPAIDLVALAKGTFKRLAWAYGCSPRGSAEEAVLERMLRDRVIEEMGEPACTGLTARWCPRCGYCKCGEGSGVEHGIELNPPRLSAACSDEPSCGRRGR